MGELNGSKENRLKAAAERVRVAAALVEMTSQACDDAERARESTHKAHDHARRTLGKAEDELTSVAKEPEPAFVEFPHTGTMAMSPSDDPRDQAAAALRSRRG